MLKLTHAPVFDFRGRQALVLFPDVPYWFAAEREYAWLLRLLEGGIEREQLAEAVSREFEASRSESAEFIEGLLSDLSEVGVIQEGKVGSSPPRTISPHEHIWGLRDVLEFEVTSACNLRCLHCNVSAGIRKEGELTLAEIQAVMESVRQYYGSLVDKRVVFTGGEPFMRRDMFAILDAAVNLGFNILVNTNALLITRAMAEKLGRYKNLRLSVSLDGATRGTHEYIRGRDTFERTLRAVRLLVDHGADVSISTLVHTGNLDELGQVFSLCRDLGVRGLNPITVVIMGRAADNKLKPVPEKDFFRLLNSLIRDNPEYYRLLGRATFPNMLAAFASNVQTCYCGVGERGTIFVDSSGGIFPCPNMRYREFKLGTVKTMDSVDELYSCTCMRRLRALSVDSMNEKCAQCDVRYFCGGYCRGETFFASRDIKSPYVRCAEFRDGIWEALWILAEDHAVYQDRIEEFSQNAERKSVAEKAGDSK